ncbi:MAG: hypothetical protein H7X88_08705, partial [Gloeobacteraceae cyanobacterium ES-bin-316]|nr:hypothetical protein [Ferruginibacter sp.]
LIYYGRDNDPFQEVKEWWNTNGNKYKSPSIHLFEKLGIKLEENISNYVARKGKVFVVRQDPKELVLKASADVGFVQLVKDAYEKTSAGSRFETKNNFMLQRGPYLIAAVMDESVSSKPLHLKGTFIDLFDPGLAVLKEKLVAPGTQAFLYDLSKVNSKIKPLVLAAAARMYQEKAGTHHYDFVVKSPSNTNNIMRILLPSKPVSVVVTEANVGNITLQKNQWDEPSGTLLLGFQNYSDGVAVNITW